MREAAREAAEKQNQAKDVFLMSPTSYAKPPYSLIPSWQTASQMKIKFSAYETIDAAVASSTDR